MSSIIYQVLAALALVAISAALVFYIMSQKARGAPKNKSTGSLANAAPPDPSVDPRVQRLRREDFLNETKNRLEIRIRTDEERTHFNLIQGSNMIEIVVGVSLHNTSSQEIVIRKIAWDLWVAGHHIKEGVVSDNITIAPNASYDKLNLHELLLESQIADLSVAFQSKMSSYLEGVLQAETKYGIFSKKFTLLNLNLTFSSETKQKLQSFMNAGMTDSLTGLMQRKFLEENLQTMINKNVNHHPISFAMIDLDGFKKINDQYGHLVGDDVLKTVCAEIRNVVGDKGIGIRYGGDEFAVIFPDSSAQAAQAILEEIRANVEKMEFKTPEGPVRVTLSIGLSSASEKVNFKVLVKHADDTLRFSKQNGKNRVSLDLRKISTDWDI